jgi:hypothetical protein
VRLEGIGKLKKLYDLIGIHIRDLPACCRVLQPTMLPVLKHSIDWLYLRIFLVLTDKSECYCDTNQDKFHKSHV